MLRVAVALAIILATAALTVAVPELAVGIVMLGGVIAVAVAATHPRNDTPRDQPTTRQDDVASADAIVASIAEPIMVAVDGRVRLANAAARAMLGAHIVGEDVRLAIRHPAAVELLSSGAGQGTRELAGLGGGDRRISMHVATLGPGRILIHLLDHTVHHAAERARTDFVANSSHELRTPLAAVIGFIETLDDETADADPAVRKRFLSVMMKEARRMQRLIDDLISLSRIEAEKHSLPETPVDLRALAKEVAGEVRGEVSLDLPASAATVQGDRTQLSQLLHNLIGNAIKYGHANTPVRVTLAKRGSMYSLAVIDRGEGIPPEHLPRLTERFYRVDPGRSRALGGTGLGLAIAKHIVERHRGRLDIASTPGVGTTVSILLPTADPTAVTELPPIRNN